MNIAIGNKTLGRNFRFGVGAFVTALSVATIAGVGIWHVSDSPSPQPAANAPVTSLAVRPVESGGRAITPVHYYLVNSDDQISALDQALFEAETNSPGAAAAWSTYTIDVRTPEGQELARTLQEDLYIASLDSAFDASLVQVHDLTVAPARPTTEARSDFVASEPQASTYIVGSEAERQQLFNEADVAAAVEGGDFLKPTVIVIDASDPEALQLEAAITDEGLNGGANIIDLR